MAKKTTKSKSGPKKTTKKTKAAAKPSRPTPAKPAAPAPRRKAKEVPTAVSSKSVKQPGKGLVRKRPVGEAATATVAGTNTPADQVRSGRKGRLTPRALPRMKPVNSVPGAGLRRREAEDETDTPRGEVFGPLPDEQLRKVKTGLRKRDLEHYRQLLLQKRSELLGDVESLQTDARNAATTAISYEHMADTGTENYEMEFTLGLVESERRLLAEINEALVRLQNGTYGVCVESGKPITRTRLDAKPWAKYSIEVARNRERRGLSA